MCTRLFATAFSVGRLRPWFLRTFLFCLLNTLLLLTTQRLSAATVTVTNTHDSGAGSLRQLITDAAPGDTVLFDAGLSGQTILLSTPLTLTQDLTITGSALVTPPTLSGNRVTRVLAVDLNVQANIAGLIITDGYSEQGGGLYNQGITTLLNVHFVQNHANHGGAIYNGQSLTVDNSTFRTNWGTGNGGWFSSGGGIANQGHLQVRNSTFEANDATFGGAISSATPVTITQSTFRQNRAIYGGAIDASGYGLLLVSGSAFIGNQAHRMGGAIETNSNTTIARSTFRTNRASVGGAIHYADDIAIFTSTFSANKADYGSALTNGGAMRAFGELSIYNSTLIGNTSPDGPVSALTGFHLYNSIIAHSHGPDCSITPDPNVNNLIADGSCAAAVTGDPRLGPLHPSNDPQQAYLLLPASPAIDAGDNATCQASDQTGAARPVDGNGDGMVTCDIGAIERYPITDSLEIYLQGNQQWISNGDNTPDLADHTDFGQTARPYESLTRTFVISNLGAIDLTDLHITLSGEQADTFQISRQPSPVITAGTSDAFQIRFYSPTLGAHQASAVVQGNGAPTPLYTFAITGRDCRPALTVTGNTDSGPGSLRQAIADLCADGSIRFAADLAGQTIALQQPFALDKNLTLDGATPSRAVILNGNNAVRVFNITNGVAVTLKRLIIANGRAPDGYGGGISNHGVLTITNSTIMNNFTPFYLTDLRFPPYALGGGIYNAGRLSISNSTFTSNEAEQGGGAIFTSWGATDTVTITHSTLSNNGAAAIVGPATLYNTIISGGSSSGCWGTVATGSVNLIEDGSCGASATGELLLGPLQDNGGGILTHALLPGSPAIDAADPAACTPLDQRGIARPLDGNGDGVAACDLGAVEALMIPTAPPPPTPTATPTVIPIVAPTVTSTPTPIMPYTATPPTPTVTHTPPPLVNTVAPPLADTPTATLTATSTVAAPCPNDAAVEPVLSPTDQLSQTIVVNASNGAIVQVTTLSGTFHAVTTAPYRAPITLLPNLSHPLTVTVTYSQLGGASPTPCQAIRTVDKLGVPLVIMQQSLPTPAPTVQPQQTPHHCYLPFIQRP